MSKSRKKVAVLSALAVSLLFVSVSAFLLAQSRAPSTVVSKEDGAASMATRPLYPFHLSQNEKDKLLSEHFAEVKDANALPGACKTAFSALIQEPAFSLASPGQPFQATDVILAGQRLPWRRLIIGGVTSDRCVIYYEKGGFAATYAAVVIDISKADAPAFIWGGLGGGVPQDVSALVGLITQDAFKQGDNNSW